MAIFGVYIINRAGGLIYQYDQNMPRVEVEKTFSYPLELVLKIYDEKVVVAFGQRDGVKGKLNLDQHVIIRGRVTPSDGGVIILDKIGLLWGAIVFRQ